MPMQRQKVIENHDRKPLASFIGGMRYGVYNFTVPLVRLELFADSLRLSSSVRLFRKLVPILTASFADVSSVQMVGNSFGSGIRIRTRGSERGVVFWTFSPERVLSSMQKLGLTTIAEEGHFYFRNPDR
jgi:hypothetical protein